MDGEASADARETRQAIMRATYRALCEHGYADLSMQDIADEFDKSRSLLHYHYDTREELLLAFVDNLVGWIGDRIEESDATDPRARLLAYVDQFMPGPGDDETRDFLVALFELRMQAVHNERFREKLARHYRSNVEVAAEIIAEGVEEGVFRPVDPYDTAETIYMAIEGARMYQVVLGAEGAARRMQDAIRTYVVAELVDTPALLAENFEE